MQSVISNASNVNATHYLTAEKIIEVINKILYKTLSCKKIGEAASAVNSLAGAAEKAQKMQRIALGLDRTEEQNSNEDNTTVVYIKGITKEEI